MSKSNVLKKIFPEPLHNNLAYDNEGLWSITHPTDADIISSNILLLNNNCKSIIDMTAGCGGNTISFCKYFNNVTGIENNSSRFSILESNIKCYDINNITLLCTDSVEYIKTCNPYDVYFLDPPWGGPDYKKYNNLELTLSNINLLDLIDIIPKNKIIVIKLPYNYNIINIINKCELLLKLEIRNIIILYLLNA